MINNILQNALKENALVGIRTDREDWDESLIGFITGLDDQSVTINELDKDGVLTGSTIILLADIVSLDFDDRYQQRLRLIYDSRSLIESNNQVTIWRTGSDLSDYLDLLVKSKNIATLYFDEDNYVFGIVKAFDSNYILIHNVGIEGDDDGESCHLIDNLIGVKYSGIDEQKITILYKNKEIFYKKL
jgi:hypothetical protein